MEARDKTVNKEAAAHRDEMLQSIATPNLEVRGARAESKFCRFGPAIELTIA